MSDSAALPQAPEVANPIRNFARLTRTWLTAPDRGDARMLIILLLVLTGVQVGIQIAFNLWNRDFFNALENRDGAAFRAQIIKFFILAALSMGTAVYQLYVKQLIQLRWRGWLTNHLVSAWLRDGRQYQLEMAGRRRRQPGPADRRRCASGLRPGRAFRHRRAHLGAHADGLRRHPVDIVVRAAAHAGRAGGRHPRLHGLGGAALRHHRHLADLAGGPADGAAECGPDVGRGRLSLRPDGGRGRAAKASPSSAERRTSDAAWRQPSSASPAASRT